MDSTSTHCNSTGPHFNPQNKLHWVPGDEERQAGDLGNIVADQYGIADVCLKDLQILLYQIPLSGSNSILGRVVVVHADPDDLGRGGHELAKAQGMQVLELDVEKLGTMVQLLHCDSQVTGLSRGNSLFFALYSFRARLHAT